MNANKNTSDDSNVLFSDYSSKPGHENSHPHKKRHLKGSFILSILLALSLALSAFVIKTNADTNKALQEQKHQVQLLSEELVLSNGRTDAYRQIFGELTLPQLSEGAGNYDEVVNAYENQLGRLVSRSNDLRNSLNEIKKSNPNKPAAPVDASVDEEYVNPKRVCYLTFDDGPSDNTLKILEVLKRYNAKATFFVIGRGKLDYVKNIKEEGHTVALHSDTHNYQNIYSSVDAYFADLQGISDKVENITGEKPMLIRFPGGSSNTTSISFSKGIMTELTRMVEEKGYSYFDWNIDSGDASGTNIPATKLVNNIKAQNYKLYSNICVLCHDTSAKDTTVEALPEIIEHLSAQGFVFEGLTASSPGFHHRINN